MCTCWENTPNHSALISLGTHSLHLTTEGPSRSPGAPIAIIIPGITSSIKEWPVSISLISQSLRVLSYERAGYGLSEVSHNCPTAEQIAIELLSLLRAAEISPPFIFVCHSWGGIIAREVLHRLTNRADVAGMVFVDANTEETPSTFPNPAVSAVQGDTDTLRVCVGDTHKLSPSQWAALLEEEARPQHAATAQSEIAQYHASGPTLAAKKQLEASETLLGDAPVVVLHANYALDLQRIYDAGVAKGNGTAVEKRAMRAFVKDSNALEEAMQRRTLGLSRKSRFLHVEQSGHNVHMVAPEIVAEAVKWVVNSEVEGDG